MLIGIIGNAYAGKDTCANYIVKKYKYQKKAFADPIREIVKIMFMFSDNDVLIPKLKTKIDPVFNESPRSAMQLIGTDLVRKHYSQDFWLHHMKQRLNPNVNIVISDIRFQNEANMVLKHGGILIKIIRYDTNDNHISERGVKDITGFKYIIYNDKNIQCLYDKIDKIMKKIIK